MKQNSSPLEPTRHDSALLRNTLLKLTAAHKIVCVVVIAVVALVWYDLLNQLVAFGHNIDYSGLHALGNDMVQMLKLYNPYFWWGVVALCTLIIAYFLYLFVQSTQRRVRTRLVSADIIKALAQELSRPAKDVLLWVWQDRHDPITVGDLQRTADELHARRADKIRLAQEHASALLDEQGGA
jgi:hypothetical protein